MKTQHSKRMALLAAAGLLAWAACDQGATHSTDPVAGPTGPAGPSGPISGPSFVILPGGVGPGVDDGDGAATHEEFELCKTGSAATFDYSVTAPPGGTTTTGSVTLNDGECRILALFGGFGANVTVTEQDPVGFDFDHVDVTTIFEGVVSGPTTSTNPTVGPELISGTNGGGLRGVLAVYTNVPEPPPPGGEGCTPGYWKNHAGLPKPGNGKGLQFQPDSWAATGFATGDDFDTTFGVDLFNPDVTLLEALNLGGGGVNALARHGVAGLLSAAHPGVAYDFTVAEVIALVQAGDKDALAAANEQGCPL